MEIKNRVIFLDGPGIYLRPADESDLSYFVRWMNDPDVRKYLGGDPLPTMLTSEREWFHERHKQIETNPILVIVEKDGDIPIGSLDFHGINRVHGTALTGISIGAKEKWGKGFGYKATMLLLHYAFYTFNLRKLYWYAYTPNKGSIKCAEKCGYVSEAVLKEDYFVDGEYVDTHILSVYREKWEPLWEDFLKRYPKETW